ncbi:WDR78 protein, partial [Polypterus senegalus]
MQPETMLHQFGLEGLEVIHAKLTNPRDPPPAGIGRTPFHKTLKKWEPVIEVLDEQGNDVTPLPLFHPDPNAPPPKQSNFFASQDASMITAPDFLSTISMYQTGMNTSFAGPFTRSIIGSSTVSKSSRSTVESMNEEIEEPGTKRVISLSLSDVQIRREEVKDIVTEDMLDKTVDVYLTETETLWILDMPATMISTDAEEAETVKLRTQAYVELCKNRLGNDLYVDRMMQTLNDAPKCKEVQCDKIIRAEADPDCKPPEEDGIEEEPTEVTTTTTPTLDRLWSFSCEDLLAVGYGEFDFRDQKGGLVCCWSLKNPMWPERVYHCESGVTSLDFSIGNPNLLAVGMHNGEIVIFNVQRQEDTPLIDSSNCFNKHTGPVWQLQWIEQERGASGDDKGDSLISVSADGKIAKWYLRKGLDCTDLMKLKRTRGDKSKKPTGEKDRKIEALISRQAPGMCFDFHPKSPVYKIAWSPFSPDVFLSCSADWTIRLWQQDLLKPVLNFSSVNRAIYEIMWSPKSPMIFGAVNEERVEIWDLDNSILDPTIVSSASPGVTLTTILFAESTDCVLIGDSDGQVTVYKMKNLTSGKTTQLRTYDFLKEAQGAPSSVWGTRRRLLSNCRSVISGMGTLQAVAGRAVSLLAQCSVPQAAPFDEWGGGGRTSFILSGRLGVQLPLVCRTEACWGKGGAVRCPPTTPLQLLLLTGRRLDWGRGGGVSLPVHNTALQCPSNDCPIRFRWAADADAASGDPAVAERRPLRVIRASGGVGVQHCIVLRVAAC